MHMQKITPHIWFSTQAKEAAQFYASTVSQLERNERKDHYRYALGRLRYRIVFADGHTLSGN